MPPKDLQTSHFTTYTDCQAELVEPGAYAGTRRFQWQEANPKVTILDFSSSGTCELVRNVPREHARYLWAKLIKAGWTRKTF